MNQNEVKLLHRYRQGQTLSNTCQFWPIHCTQNTWIHTQIVMPELSFVKVPCSEATLVQRVNAIGPTTTDPKSFQPFFHQLKPLFPWKQGTLPPPAFPQQLAQ